MNCQFCSEPIPEGDSFCGACGARAPGASARPDAPVDAAPSIPAADTWGHELRADASAPPWRSTYFSGDEDAGTPQYAYAGFWLRFVAAIIDGAIAISATLASAVVVAAVFDGLTGFWVTIFFILFYVPIAFTYFLIATAVGGGWGKRSCGLRIVAFEDGSAPGYGKAFVRVLVTGAFGLLGGFIPVIGFLATLIDPLSMLWDERKQTYHDKVAGTVVIRV